MKFLPSNQQAIIVKRWATVALVLWTAIATSQMTMNLNACPDHAPQTSVAAATR